MSSAQSYRPTQRPSERVSWKGTIDIVIAYETTEREARTQGKPFAHHLAHLAVHGFLHLLGYDHQAEHDAHAMEELEASILARLGVPNPHC